MDIDHLLSTDPNADGLDDEESEKDDKTGKFEIKLNAVK